MPYSTPVLTGSIPSPATAPLTGVLNWSASTEPSPNTVQLLLLMAGANTSQTFVDSSVNAFTVTNHNASTQSNTEAPSFETTSGDFTSVSGNQYVSVPLVGGGPLDLSTVDFTIEGWIYSPASMIGAEGSFIATSTFQCEMVTNQAIGENTLSVSICGTSFSASSVIPNSTWTAFAITSAGNTLTMWINGTAVATTTYADRAANPFTDTAWEFGQCPGSIPGSVYLSNIRISTSALYSGPYTPTGPLSPGGGTTYATGYDIYRNGVSIAKIGQV